MIAWLIDPDAPHRLIVAAWIAGILVGTGLAFVRERLARTALFDGTMLVCGVLLIGYAFLKR